MVNINTLCNRLVKNGLDAEIVILTRNNFPYHAIRVKHDYNGLYPDGETMRKHHAACEIARRAGYKAEQRGSYTATYINTWNVERL